jgi:hyperosmotically inducible periplasmic protein
MKTTILHAALAAALATLALAGCHRDGGDQTVGQKLDSALATTQHKLAEAGKETKEKLAVAGEKAKEELSSAGKEISRDTDKAIASVKEKTQEIKPASDGSTTTTTTTTVASTEGGKPMSDTAITASIKADYLKDPDLSVLKIDVDTKGGVVTLNGLANDEQARTRAEKLAGAIKGVKEVRNFLVIKRA